MGSRGDSYDDAVAESVIGSFKTEVIQYYMSELRELRRRIRLSRRECAAVLRGHLETFPIRDSGQRPTPTAALLRAKSAVVEHAHRTEFLPFNRLASELRVHVQTLRAAAKTGRGDVQLNSKSFFGRPCGWRHQRLARSSSDPISEILP